MTPVLDAQSTSALVIGELKAVAEEQGKSLPLITEKLSLLNSGLDSLCIAILVARLEDRFGFDPFSGDEPVSFPVTLGDFIRAYERAPA